MEYLKIRLKKLWKIKGNIHLSHLGLNFLLAFDLLHEDRLSILTSPPLCFNGYPILKRSWVPFFSPTYASTSIITSIWINLPYLPFELQCPKALICIGNNLGKIIALDPSPFSKNKFSKRLCIEINLSFDLPKNILINDFNQQIIFENIYAYNPLISEIKNTKLLSPNNSLPPLLPTPTFPFNSNLNLHKKAPFQKYQNKSFFPGKNTLKSPSPKNVIRSNKTLPSINVFLSSTELAIINEPATFNEPEEKIVSAFIPLNPAPLDLINPPIVDPSSPATICTPLMTSDGSPASLPFAVSNENPLPENQSETFDSFSSS